MVTVIQTLNGDHGDDVTHGCNFAIRGGGHTTWSGASNVDGGITIDMSHLNDVELSDDKNVVSISAGARWKQVYAKLDPLGFTVAGGRDADVGVAGLTLGGMSLIIVIGESNSHYSKGVCHTSLREKASHATMSSTLKSSLQMVR